MAPKSRGRGVARGTLGTTARAGSSRSPPEAPGCPWPGLVRIDPVTASDSVSRASRGGEPVGARQESQDGPTVAPPRAMAGGPGPGPGDPAAVAAAAAGRTLTWPRAGGRDPAEQGEAPPRTGYSPPRAEHSGRPGDATQGWGALVVIVPRVRSLLLVLHFAFSLRSRLRRRAPALDPPVRRRSTSRRAPALGGRCRDRSGPVGFLTGQMDQAAGGVRPG